MKYVYDQCPVGNSQLAIRCSESGKEPRETKVVRITKA